jgi:hypothetical protein
MAIQPVDPSKPSLGAIQRRVQGPVPRGGPLAPTRFNPHEGNWQTGNEGWPTPNRATRVPGNLDPIKANKRTILRMSRPDAGARAIRARLGENEHYGLSELATERYREKPGPFKPGYPSTIKKPTSPANRVKSF